MCQYRHETSYEHKDISINKDIEAGKNKTEVETEQNKSILDLSNFTAIIENKDKLLKEAFEKIETLEDNKVKIEDKIRL